MEPVGNVTPHQAISTFAIQVEPSAAGYDDAISCQILVVHSLEPGLPTPILVKLIQHDWPWSAVG